MLQHYQQLQSFAWGGNLYLINRSIDNHHFQLGSDHPQFINHPKLFTFPLLELHCGSNFVIILSSKSLFYQYSPQANLKVFSMGLNQFGVLGLSNPDYQFQATQPTPISKFSSLKVKSLSVGSQHCFAKLDCGTLFSWGRGDYGQLANDQSIHKDEPELANVQKDVHSISCGTLHTLILCKDNTISEFGDNKIKVVEIKECISQVAAGHQHSLYLAKSGNVYGSGSNKQYQLGLGLQVANSPQPQQIPYLLNIKKVAACNYSAALNKNGLLYLWGTGPFGVLDKPQIVHTQSFKKISVMGDQGAVLDTSGNVYVWGKNENGQLGLGDKEKRSKPDKVNALKGYIVNEIRVSDSFCFAFTKQRKEETQVSVQIQQKMISNPLTMIHILQNEKQQLQESLMKEREERIVMEGLNKELKKSLQNLQNDEDNRSVEFREKSEQFNLMSARMEEVNNLNNYLSNQLSETRAVLNQTIRQSQQRMDQICQLEQNLENLQSKSEQDQLTQRKLNQEILNLSIEMDELKRKRGKENRENQDRIENLEIQLSCQKELFDKLNNGNEQKQRQQDLMKYHYGKLQEQYSKQEQKIQRLVEQLQTSYKMHIRLQEALEKSQKRSEQIQFIEPLSQREMNIQNYQSVKIERNNKDGVKSGLNDLLNSAQRHANYMKGLLKRSPDITFIDEQ